MESNELIIIVEQSGLEKTKGQVLLDKFSAFKTWAKKQTELIK